ncbi:MAG: hypothetical protein SGPRY_004089 [Prymnesium sp.]
MAAPMLRRIVVGIGRGFRETGQAIDRMGCRAQDNWLFAERICRHRAIMNLFDQRPKLGSSVFVAPNASVIGSVDVNDYASIWYGSVIRGDQSNVYIGAYASIGDRTTIQSAAINPTGFSARTYVGDYVTVGQGCILRACTVDDFSVIGDGCIIQEGALVDRSAMLEPGSLLPTGARVPPGEVYGGSPATFKRKLHKEEIDEFKETAEQTAALGAKHADEFLPYGTLYQLREEMAAKVSCMKGQAIIPCS